MSNLTTVSVLKSLPPGNPFAGAFVLKKSTTRTAKTGTPFYSLDFGDKTGTFNCKVFSDNSTANELKAVSEGAIVRVEGVTGTYQGQFSPKIEYIVEIALEEVERNGLAEILIESSPEDFDALCAELEEHLSAIPNTTVQAVARSVIDEISEIFKNSPAAISMHHAYRHGLLEHSNHLARVARVLLPLYPEVDPSLAIAGAILHDVGKTLEYTQGLSTRRTRAGILQGHVVLGYRIVRKHGIKNKLPENLQERLEHIILSHQGELEWGAAAIAATPEAVFISLVDNFDAKMGMVQAALRSTLQTEEFSEFIPGLKSPLLITPA